MHLLLFVSGFIVAALLWYVAGVLDRHQRDKRERAIHDYYNAIRRQNGWEEQPFVPYEPPEWP
jgi:hypothetical protein